VQPFVCDREVAADLAGARVRRRDDGVESPRDEALHPDRVELDGPDGFRELRVAAERSAPVDRERMVDRRNDGQAERADPEQTPAETLDVVDEVVSSTRSQPRAVARNARTLKAAGSGKKPMRLAPSSHSRSGESTAAGFSRGRKWA
jgi:hypothetical protein